MFVYCLEFSFEETLHVLLVIDGDDNVIHRSCCSFHVMHEKESLIKYSHLFRGSKAELELELPMVQVIQVSERDEVSNGLF